MLTNLNIHIEKGQKVALVGPSGSGKTTLCNLIPRFYEITDGEILIDDTNIQDVTLKSLRTNIGVVQQDVYLFSGTVKENIRYGKIDATDEDVVKAAKSANIHHYIMTQSDTYNMILNEETNNISAGEKQLLTIARALVANPQILILDEATSMLDPNGRKEVIETVRKLNRDNNMTVVLITHYMEEAALADRIIVLHEGKVKMMGTPKEIFSDAEMMKALKLGVPVVSELSYESKKRDIDFKNCLSVDEFINEFEKVTRF